MSIALDSEQLDLAKSVQDFALAESLAAQTRARLEGGPVPARTWAQMAELGWLGVHVPEEYGGAGVGLTELAVIVAELAHGLAPQPVLPTVAASAVLTTAPDAHGALLTRLASGASAAFGLGQGLELEGTRVSGRVRPVVGAPDAVVAVVAAGPDVVVVPLDRAGVTWTPLPGTDPGREVGELVLDGVDVDVLPGARARAEAVLRTLLAAEAAGLARATQEQAVAYVKIREQFGRAVGSFQAVKHHCASLLVAAETAEAVAWGAARAADGPPAEFALAAAAAIHVASDSAVRNAELNIQLHGGIGFTWEHDAHLYLRRAIGLAALAGAEQSAAEVAAATLDGVRLALDIDLPESVEAIRPEVAALAAEAAAQPAEELRGFLQERGYLVPHWPAPWGVGADPGTTMLIDREFAKAGVERPSIGYAAFLVLTIVSRGTPEQVTRWVPPVLAGEEAWCQLFSEPGAGSDAAGIRTRGTRTEGGWILNGQKVWSSGAHLARWGLATVRTDPHAGKHAGLTMMVVDMRAPGVTLRPLRQITGESGFNETFLDDVFVPDADVIGEPGEGWPLVRETLGNERTVLGDGAGAGPPLAGTLQRVQTFGDGPVVRDLLGGHVAEEIALRLLNFRRSLKVLAGADAAALGAVTKLVGSQHGQQAAALDVVLSGADALVADGPAGDAVTMTLSMRRLTIAGGTSEITRNQIAERLLGLPREIHLDRSRK